MWMGSPQRVAYISSRLEECEKLISQEANARRAFHSLMEGEIRKMSAQLLSHSSQNDPAALQNLQQQITALEEQIAKIQHPTTTTLSIWTKHYTNFNTS